MKSLSKLIKTKKPFIGIPPEMLKKMRQNLLPSGPNPSEVAFIDEGTKKEPFKDIFDGLQRLNEMIDENVKGFAGR